MTFVRTFVYDPKMYTKINVCVIIHTYIYVWLRSLLRSKVDDRIEDRIVGIYRIEYI